MTKKAYVLDTSVLLTDPKALTRFEDNLVVIPWATLEELEAKRNHPDLGYFAREALRTLEDLRVKHGRLNAVPVNDEDGHVTVQPSHYAGTSDASIIQTARDLAERRPDEVILVTNDLPMRIKASTIGLDAEPYRAAAAEDSCYSGMVEVPTIDEYVAMLHAGGIVGIDPSRYPVNSGVILTGPSSTGLGRVTSPGATRALRTSSLFGVRGRSAEQKVALDLLDDDSVGIVSLGGRAGTGKSVLALAAGLEHTLERGTYEKVIIFRPLYAVGGQELGYLPGTLDEKMGPWAQAVYDALGAITSREVVEEVTARGLVEVQPLTHIRGRSLHDAFVIVDEAQSLERGVLLTVLSRIGQNARVVLTHDTAQRDNLHVGRFDGIVAVIDALKGHPLFGHVTLTRSERSAIAELVTDLL